MSFQCHLLNVSHGHVELNPFALDVSVAFRWLEPHDELHRREVLEELVHVARDDNHHALTLRLRLPRRARHDDNNDRSAHYIRILPLERGIYLDRFRLPSRERS